MSRRAIQQALREVRVAGAAGLLLAGRDGVPVASDMDRPVQQDAFGAMVAALHGAAEAAAAEWTEGRPTRSTVEAGDLRLVVMPVGSEHLLAGVVPTASLAPVRQAMAAAVPRVAQDLLR